jgi:cytoskeletal protein CcmA (bactofilin family)
MIWRRKQEHSFQPVQDATVITSAAKLQGKDGEATTGSGQVPVSEQGMLNARNTDRVIGTPDVLSSKFWSQPVTDDTQRTYVVPRGYKIAGAIYSTRPVVIYGELEGRELVAGVATVMPGGVLRGDSRTGVLLAAGLVEGHVQVDQLIEVSSQGEVGGEVRAPAIQVHPGARLSGASLQIGSR